MRCNKAVTWYVAVSFLLKVPFYISFRGLLKRVRACALAYFGASLSFTRGAPDANGRYQGGGQLPAPRKSLSSNEMGKAFS
jgi:hypothetical protein